jgi:hypothetical protein
MKDSQRFWAAISADPITIVQAFSLRQFLEAERADSRSLAKRVVREQAQAPIDDERAKASHETGEIPEENTSRTPIGKKLRTSTADAT